MKIAIITDQHFGCRKNSKLFHDYFLKFYNDVFFPALEEEGIDTVIDMGDTFDSRKGIDFSALTWAKENYFDRLKDMGITVHTIVGNHTAYYKNTNEIIKSFESIYAAAKELNISPSGISQCCNHYKYSDEDRPKCYKYNKQYKGFVFKFLNSEE